MTDVNTFVKDIDGVRDEVATAVAARFDSVEELAAAPKAHLQAVNGVGPVLASRILEAARGAASAAGESPSDDRLPPRMRSAIADAAAAARPMLSVVGETAEDVATDGSRDRDVEVDLPPTVARVATVVGLTVGWTIRICRQLTVPLSRLLHRA